MTLRSRGLGGRKPMVPRSDCVAVEQETALCDFSNLGTILSEMSL